MKIESISVNNDGYIYCKSSFYEAIDVLNNTKNYVLRTGINFLDGEIDSGNWAVSFLLSMYPYVHRKKLILFDPHTVAVNNETISLESFSKYTCYMDCVYPLFSSKKSVRKMIMQGLSKNHFSENADNIRDLFHIDPQRFDRSLSGVGNEIFKCMAAIGYVHNKQVFCFPWLSKMRFDNYHEHLTDLLEILKSLNVVVVFPVAQGTVLCVDKR